MRAIGVALICVLGVSACSQRDKEFAFDGQYYRASARKVAKETRQNFIVSVKPVSASFEGALQAGEYEGTKYCIAQYGISEIEWTLGPDEDPETYVISNDTLELSGTCIE